MKLRKVLKGVLKCVIKLFIGLKYIVEIIAMLYYLVAFICFLEITYEIFDSIREFDANIILYAVSSISLLIMNAYGNWQNYRYYKREERTYLQYKLKYERYKKYKEESIMLQEENLELRNKLIEVEAENDRLKLGVSK